MLESDMYIPVKAIFTQLGYIVNSEVNSIDVTAVKDDELIIIEMKTQLNMKLLIQAAKRQRITPKVYVAIPRPEYKKRYAKDFKDKEYLLRRLELGLIFVNINKNEPFAQIVFHPKKFDRKKSMSFNKRKTRSAMNEISDRHGDHNIGGTTGRKLITVYREKALFIAWLLNLHGPQSAKALRALGSCETTYAILYKDYYGWFQKTSKGIYEINDLGKEALKEYNDILQ